MRKRETKMTKLPRTRRQKAKFHETVCNHSDAGVRLAADFLADAMTAARAGNLQDMITNIRLASRFAKTVSLGNPEEYMKSHA